MTTMLIVIIVLALVFDYINGFHDAANSIATIVSTKVLTPFQAVLWAALFNFVAYFIFKDHAVANTIGKTVREEFITLPVVFSGLIAAIIWNLVTWWYGIPSSSSHTLIGGFGGAAIAHAFYTKGFNVPIADIIDSDKVTKTVLFIFLAPFIGMIISMFIAIVTIMRKTWLKILVMSISGLFAYHMFDYFEDNRVKENIGKYFMVDKLTEQAKKDPAKQEALEKAKANADKACVFAKQLDEIGAEGMADKIAVTVSLKDVEKTKLNDKLSKFFKVKQLKNDASIHPEDKAIYETAKESYEQLKPLTALYHTANYEMMVDSMLRLHPMDEKQAAAFKKELNINAKKDLASDIDKADNSIIAWGVIVTIIVFGLSFIYTEKLRSPSAFREANMYKRLQLLSSAAFSIGHGGNDAQKVMGIIGAALFASGIIPDAKNIPDWVPIACYTAIAAGTMSGGWKIVKTMGTRITKVTPLEGVSAETAGALTLFMTEQMGIPVSTTHTITGAIIGVGATKRLSAVRWGVTVNLLWAWILTIPVSAAMAGLVYWVFRFFA
jgi:PiT family inorganic phosphate transporter